LKVQLSKASDNQIAPEEFNRNLADFVVNTLSLRGLPARGLVDLYRRVGAGSIAFGLTAPVKGLTLN
jgi:hypothetical protein